MHSCTFAAMGENIGAAMSMGFRHLHGIGVTKNCSTAAVYYEIAANAAIDALGASMVPRWQSPRLERLGKTLARVQTARCSSTCDLQRKRVTPRRTKCLV